MDQLGGARFRNEALADDYDANFSQSNLDWLLPCYPPVPSGRDQHRGHAASLFPSISESGLQHLRKFQAEIRRPLMVYLSNSCEVLQPRLQSPEPVQQ